MSMQYQIEVVGKLSTRDTYNTPEDAHRAFCDLYSKDEAEWYYLLTGRPLKLGDLLTDEDISGAIRENAAAAHVDDSFLDGNDDAPGEEVRSTLGALVRRALNGAAETLKIDIHGFKVLGKARVERGD